MGKRVTVLHVGLLASACYHSACRSTAPNASASNSPVANSPNSNSYSSRATNANSDDRVPLLGKLSALGATSAASSAGAVSSPAPTSEAGGASRPSDVSSNTHAPVELTPAALSTFRPAAAPPKACIQCAVGEVGADGKCLQRAELVLEVPMTEASNVAGKLRVITWGDSGDSDGVPAYAVSENGDVVILDELNQRLLGFRAKQLVFSETLDSSHYLQLALLPNALVALADAQSNEIVIWRIGKGVEARRAVSKTDHDWLLMGVAVLEAHADGVWLQDHELSELYFTPTGQIPKPLRLQGYVLGEEVLHFPNLLPVKNPGHDAARRFVQRAPRNATTLPQPSEIAGADAISADSTNRVYMQIADSTKACIQVFDRDWKLVRELGVPVWDRKTTNQPITKPLFVTDGGALYWATSKKDMWQLFRY